MMKKEPARFRAAIFDLDGTLCYTYPDLKASLNAALREMGYPERTDRELYENVNCGVREWVRGGLPEELRRDEEAVDRALGVYTGIYAAHYCDHTVVYPDLEKAVRRMKDAGFRLAVHTNKEQAEASGMVEKLLPGLFDSVLGDGCCPSKPDPAGVYMLARQAGIPLSDFVFIGDSHVDMQTAKNAGVFALGVSWGYRPEAVLWENGADAVVRTPRDLERFFFPED
jgi:phosphoglycolate phosphatase